jgi:hypothetical protein
MRYKLRAGHLRAVVPLGLFVGFFTWLEHSTKLPPFPTWGEALLTVLFRLCVMSLGTLAFFAVVRWTVRGFTEGDKP